MKPFCGPKPILSKDIQVPGLRISRRGAKEPRKRLSGLTETLRLLIKKPKHWVIYCGVDPGKILMALKKEPSHPTVQLSI